MNFVIGRSYFSLHKDAESDKRKLEMDEEKRMMMSRGADDENREMLSLSQTSSLTSAAAFLVAGHLT
jgi:hypothetical protein